MIRTCKLVLAVAAIFAMTATGVSAAYPDSFEGYAVGGGVIGQGTWVGWEGSTTNDAIVTDALAHTGEKCLQLGGDEAVDIVPRFTGANSGVWEYSAWTYIPANVTGGVCDHGGLSSHKNFDGATSTQWFGHIGFNLGGGMMGSQPIVYDDWAEVKSLLDIDNKTFTLYYNGVEAGTGAWGGDNAIVGMDVYTSGGLPAVYLDDVNMVPVPEPATLSLLGMGVTLLLACGWRKRR